jgi:lipid-A-disaccharide synthase
MISCGEASGDLYAGALVAALGEADPGVQVFGFGGGRLAAAGADLVGRYERFAVTGIVEALSVIPRSFRMLQHLRDQAARRRPDVFVAIDFPDFNFRLLPAMRALGIPVVYYVSPQLWAWRPGRIETLKGHVDRMLVIFPFEAAIYERAGVPVTFVGHPLVDLARTARPHREWLTGIGIDPAKPIVALLPGSRPNEVRRILPVIARAVPAIAARVPGVQFIVARAPSLEERLFVPLQAVRSASTRFVIVDGAADDVIAAANVVITASGTATVQTALHGRPMVIVYALSPLTYAIGRSFVRVPAYGMPNLIAGRPIVPELIQSGFTPDRVASETVSLLTDEGRASVMRGDLAAVADALGAPGASRRAAEAVLEAARSRGRAG